MTQTDDPQATGSPEAATEVRMVLVRHGFSASNKIHVFSGMNDVSLTPEGAEEVRAYRARGLYPTTQRHYSSPLRRCLQTFRAAYGEDCPLDGVLDEFHEVSFGSLEGRGLSDDDSMRLWHSWLEGTAYAASFGVEPYADARARGANAVRGLARSCAREGVATVTVVTHSAIMRAALAGLAGLDEQGWLSLRVPNGMGYDLRLTCADGEARLRRAIPLDPAAPADAVVVPRPDAR